MRLGIVNSRQTFPTILVAAVSLVALTVVGSGSATEVKGPRIVSAVVLDLDGDASADGIRLRYSKPVRHVPDADGRYPFTVTGYRIVRVGAASGRLVTLVVVERSTPDSTARPRVRYRRTTSQPVKDTKGRQAIAQLYTGTLPHGHLPPATPPPPPPPPAPDTDPDKDGYAAPADCRPNDPTIHPGANDRPDVSFVDTNCDGLDGDEANAVFVSPTGDDANPGTRSKPKRQIQAAVAAIGARRDILVAAGTYERVDIVLQPAGIGIFGGYDPRSWARSAASVTTISGARDGVLVTDTRRVVLQYLTIRGVAAGPGASAYGVRAVSPSRNVDNTTLTLQSVRVSAGSGIDGAPGLDGARGLRGLYGGPGGKGQCDGGTPGAGGIGGASSIGRAGGKGGRGGAQGIHAGDSGAGGQNGTPGGSGGSSVELAGYAGKPGARGADGAAGRQGSGGTIPNTLGELWGGDGGTNGAAGVHGMGGGGGGGGGGQGGELVLDGSGNGGGGGGAGGQAGTAGTGGQAGGGSFGIYLFFATFTAEGGSIETGTGGTGGQGGVGGLGGDGGAGGLGATYCSREIGEGGNGGAGGRGGDGGGGGGGAGGSSIGIVAVKSKFATLNTALAVGQGGAGGAPRGAGPTAAAAGEAGISRVTHEATS